MLGLGSIPRCGTIILKKKEVMEEVTKEILSQMSKEELEVRVMHMIEELRHVEEVKSHFFNIVKEQEEKFKVLRSLLKSWGV